MKFKLNKEQLEYALDLAMRRHDAKHSSFRNNTTEKFRNENKSKMSDKFKVDFQYMAHFLGVIGELGYSLVTGEDVDEEIYAVRDGGQDFDGVEVKTITYMGAGEPELKIPVGEYERRIPPNSYVLVRFDLNRNEVDVLGQITRSNFDEKKKKKQYGRNKPLNYIVPLSSMERL
tara:strand:- start:2089 stop:2610 length:522 start_codon:yes stop_codon:yes gene_type:complete